MPGLDGLIGGAAALIELGGSAVIAVACLRGLGTLAWMRGSRAGIVGARLLVAEGVIAALGYKTAATLLKTIELQSWSAIGMFTAILALRTFVKRVLLWEEGRLQAERPRAPTPPAELGTPRARSARPGR